MEREILADDANVEYLTLLYETDSRNFWIFGKVSLWFAELRYHRPSVSASSFS